MGDGLRVQPRASGADDSGDAALALLSVSLAVLCAALTALAASGVPQIEPTVADTAAAKATMIRVGDPDRRATGPEAP